MRHFCVMGASWLERDRILDEEPFEIAPMPGAALLDACGVGQNALGETVDRRQLVVLEALAHRPDMESIISLARGDGRLMVNDGANFDAFVQPSEHRIRTEEPLIEC